jgi:hypothetical protein
MEKEKRTENIKVRLTPSEKEKIDELIKKYNVKNLSEFIREVILTKKYKVKNCNCKCKKEYKELLYQVSKIGVNLNQIARLCNTRGSVDAKILQVLAKMEEKLDLLLEIEEF